MTEDEDPESRFQCPGESYTISRADHLARLAAYYPDCGTCPRRHETGILSPRARKRLDQSHEAQQSAGIVHPEGVGGVAWNEFTPELARDWARAFGLTLRDRAAHGDESEGPRVLLASDGRQLSPEFVAAGAEGLRWAGCRVIDLGAATAPSLAVSVARLSADGGLMVANPRGALASVGLKFWSAQGRPLSAGRGLDAISLRRDKGLDRPVRVAPAARRDTIATEYLERLRPCFHGLRPLTLCLETACGPFIALVEQLLSPADCQLILGRVAQDKTAHLRLQVDADGEGCRVFDEKGREATSAELARLLDASLRQEAGDTREIGDLPNDVPSARCREDFWQAMHESDARLGTGAEGRYWFAGDPPVPDALAVLAHVMACLSQSDQPFSERVASETAQ